MNRRQESWSTMRKAVPTQLLGPFMSNPHERPPAEPPGDEPSAVALAQLRRDALLSSDDGTCR